LALWCLLVALLLVTLACVMVISHRSPWLSILIVVVPVVGWVYFAVMAARGSVVAAVRRGYVAVPLSVFQFGSASEVARWADSTFSLGPHSSVSGLLSFGIVLVFVGVGVPLLRVRNKFDDGATSDR
jgi:hypothetical protein